MTNNKRYSDSEIPSPSIPGSNSKRISLVTIFSGAFLGILLLFIVISSVIALRLSDFQSILSQLSGNVLPKVTLSGEAFSKVNQLTYLTARLSTSPSQAFRLIAFRDIKEKIKEIADLKLIANKDHILRTQLESIANEFNGLNLLIEERIQYQSQVHSQEEDMYQLHDQVVNRSMHILHHRKNPQLFTWIMDLSRVIALASKSLTVTRLNQVRQIGKEIKQRIDYLRSQNIALKFKDDTLSTEFVRKLNNILILEDGLLPARILELRSTGRATGRGNFVHNLVEDFARQVQFQSHQLNEVVIAEAKATTNRITTESGLIKLMAIVTFLFLAGIVFFLHRIIIKRLVNLNSSVLSKIEGKNLELNLDGNDEISDIAKSFDLLIKEIEKQRFEHEQRSLTDGLTGIANRRSLDQYLVKQIDNATKNNLPLSVLMMDVDYFKNFNDHYGHLAGDDCLKKIAQAFIDSIKRKDDFVARFGGEEFVLILPDTCTKGARVIAEEMLSAIISLKITHEWNSASPYVTLSIGSASFDPKDAIGDSELLKRADEALFRAKERGKNCFVAFEIN